MSGGLQDIPDYTSVMVDANIVIYSLFPDFPQHQVSNEFMERGVRGELGLHIAASGAADIIHRIMILEAISLGITPKTASYLKEHPQLVRQLKRHKEVLRELRKSNINILSITYKDLHASKKYRDNYGLLANDSLIVAVMEREKITYLAINDADFARVPGISVRQPE